MLRRADYDLRKIQEKDLVQVLAWRNSDRIRDCMYIDTLITWEDHYNWYHKTLDRADQLHLICEFQTQPIGVINASQLDQYHRRCAWGFYLGDTYAPKGSSYVMALLFLDLMFNDFCLRKICGEVLSFNADSIRFHQNLGFQQEGLLKEHTFKKDVYVHVLVFGLLSEQWQQVRLNVESRLFADA